MAPPRLDRLAALFIDVDGTLLEIAPRPELVRVPRGLPARLALWAGERGGALALVSGRRLADLDRLFCPWQGAAAGVHGAERRRADGSLVPAGGPQDRAAAAALVGLRAAAADWARRLCGLLVEDKGTAVALHYRAAPRHEAEILALAEAWVRPYREYLRLIAGKSVVEIQPRIHGKDRAIAAFLGEAPFRGRRPVFAGDDTTDEDGFAEVNRRGGVSVRIGPPAPTAAAYALPSVTAALAWLAAR